MMKYLLLVLMIFCLGCHPPNFTYPKPGEIWKWSSMDNPFKERHSISYKILEVKEGYVQFKVLSGPRKGVIDSEGIHYFMVGSKKVNNN